MVGHDADFHPMVENETKKTNPWFVIYPRNLQQDPLNGPLDLGI